jgi:hypothetical protein
MPEWRKLFKAEDSDFGGGAQVTISVQPAQTLSLIPISIPEGLVVASFMAVLHKR